MGWREGGGVAGMAEGGMEVGEDDDELMLNVLRCQLIY